MTIAIVLRKFCCQSVGPSDFAAIAAFRKAAEVGALFLGPLMINVLPYRLNPSSDTDGE